MLHDAANDHHSAVANRIHIDLDGVLEKFIDQYRQTGRRGKGPLYVSLQALVIKDNFHGPAPEHIRGTQHHGITDALGNAFRSGQ
jgi:hypothetical protein